MENANYYAQPNANVKPKEPLTVFCVDDAFKRLLDKYEQRLSDHQAKLIDKVKSLFEDEMKEYNKSIKSLLDRVWALERLVPSKDINALCKDTVKKRK